MGKVYFIDNSKQIIQPYWKNRMYCSFLLEHILTYDKLLNNKTESFY